MRLLLDTCVWGGAKVELQCTGHDVVWSGDWAADPGDLEILEFARREGRVLVTLDKDFGELAILKGLPHCGIVRLVGLRAREQAPLLASALEIHARELSLGAIVTVEPGRLRLRPGQA
jgi:predicted nuclease of predicted toxin-antitoxin system